MEPSRRHANGGHAHEKPSRCARAARSALHPRVQPDGTLRCTVPRGGSRREAEEFVARQRRWIERERKRVRPITARASGGTLSCCCAGRPYDLDAGRAGGRGHLGDRRLVVRTSGDSGPRSKDCARSRAKSFLPGCQSSPPQRGLAHGPISIRDRRHSGGRARAPATSPELPARPDAARRPRLRARARADAFAAAESLPTVLEAGARRLPAVS